MNRFCVTQYRSAGLPPGAFRKLGTIHLHIDGAGRVDLVTSLLQDLERRGCPGKLTAVGSSIAGPQRLELPETYASHTPGTENEEQLEYFSTTAMDSRAQAVAMVKDVLPRLAHHHGVVLELERVIATIEGGQWTETRLADVSSIYEYEVGYKRNPTMPFEIHHAFDVPDRAAAPLELDELLEDTTRLGIKVGGWFNFVKEGEGWSYRSNAFVKTGTLSKYVQDERGILDKYLSAKGFPYRLWTLVEQVLGIWRTPLQPSPADEAGG